MLSFLFFLVTETWEIVKKMTTMDFMDDAKVFRKGGGDRAFFPLSFPRLDGLRERDKRKQSQNYLMEESR